MIIPLMRSWADRIIRFLERFTNTGSWILKSALLCTFVSLFFAFPRYFSGDFRRTLQSDVVADSVRVLNVPQTVNKQIQDPLTILPSNEGAQTGKRQFRLLVPAVAHFLHLKLWHLILLQQLIGIGLFAVLLQLGFRISGDKVYSLILTLGLACTYLGSAAFTDLWPFFDAIAYFLLACALLSSRFVLILLFCFLAFWVDERALLVSPLIFLWWKVRDNGTDRFNPGSLFRLDRAWAVLVAWVFYAALRIYLARTYQLPTHTEGVLLDVLKKTFPGFLFGLFTGIEWFWLIILGGFGVLLHYRNYFLAFLLAGASSLAILPAMMVFDITKSITYIFPLVFIFLYIFKHKGQESVSMRYFLLALAMLCMLQPTFAFTAQIKYMQAPAVFGIIEQVILRK